MKVNISCDTFSASTIFVPVVTVEWNTVVLFLYDDNIQVPGVSCLHMMSPQPMTALLADD